VKTAAAKNSVTVWRINLQIFVLFGAHKV